MDEDKELRDKKEEEEVEEILKRTNGGRPCSGCQD